MTEYLAQYTDYRPGSDRRGRCVFVHADDMRGAVQKARERLGLRGGRIDWRSGFVTFSERGETVGLLAMTESEIVKPSVLEWCRANAEAE